MNTKCEDCDGTGDLTLTNELVDNLHTAAKCPTCQGTGINPEAREAVARIILEFDGRGPNVRYGEVADQIIQLLKGEKC